jgi:hypothetical protein
LNHFTVPRAIVEFQVGDQELIATRQREANRRRIKVAGYATLFYQSLNG